MLGHIASRVTETQLNSLHGRTLWLIAPGARFGGPAPWYKKLEQGTFNLHDLVPAKYPLREIKRRADPVPAGMPRDFNAACGKTGRPSIPPERLIKVLLLQALYSSPPLSTTP